MEKEQFINLVSKIKETYEDEFRAEFNSPELIWERVVKDISFISEFPEQKMFYITLFVRLSDELFNQNIITRTQKCEIINYLREKLK